MEWLSRGIDESQSQIDETVFLLPQTTDSTAFDVAITVWRELRSGSLLATTGRDSALIYRNVYHYSCSC
jgi:hypothetical protein